MNKNLTLLWAVLAILLLTSCNLPFPATPTPFTFPTPNLTLTAVYAPTETPTLPPPTLPPLDITPSPAAGEDSPETAETAEATQDLSPTGSPYPTDSVVRAQGTTVTARSVNTPPTIDGDLSDWGALPNRADIVTFGAANWTGQSDLSADYAVSWDEDNLYLAVDVTDDVHSQFSTGYNLYLGDSVEILLDADLAGDFNTAFLNSDDYQIGLSPGNFGSLKPEYYRFFPRGYGAYPSGVVVQAARTDSGYILEAKIPWTAFGINNPGAGRHYGFSLGISDNDLSSTPSQQSMVSIVSGYKLVNPATWSTLALGDASGK